MSLEHSRKLIHDIATIREADDYINGLLKNHEIRVDVERADSKWDVLMKDADTIAPERSQPEIDIER